MGKALSGELYCIQTGLVISGSSVSMFEVIMTKHANKRAMFGGNLPQNVCT